MRFLIWLCILFIVFITIDAVSSKRYTGEGVVRSKYTGTELFSTKFVVAVDDTKEGVVVLKVRQWQYLSVDKGNKVVWRQYRGRWTKNDWSILYASVGVDNSNFCGN